MYRGYVIHKYVSKHAHHVKKTHQYKVEFTLIKKLKKKGTWYCSATVSQTKLKTCSAEHNASSTNTKKRKCSVHLHSELQNIQLWITESHYSFLHH